MLHKKFDEVLRGIPLTCAKFITTQDWKHYFGTIPKGTTCYYQPDPYGPDGFVLEDGSLWDIPVGKVKFVEYVDYSEERKKANG